MSEEEKLTRKHKLIRFVKYLSLVIPWHIKRIPLYLRHGPFMLYWCLYDYFLTLWVWLKGIDSVGVYIKIMSPSEKAILFDEEDVGCGYTGCTLIKIGFRKEWATAEAVENLLGHEILHQVLGRRISNKASHKLDDVHELRKTSAIICEDGKIKILSMIRFPV